ncbi:hypothetical protein AAFF_G00116370 [Aldrovandia affinis]|uniref:Uncharacterized protein n=1 Tax=Aldrovandia affinis TaxID=143900 RepID=A0AAD7T3C7_9TELE|nr:hypothetical protein AAFF_G00116370 [Aldrovandia affinis]
MADGLSGDIRRRRETSDGSAVPVARALASHFGPALPLRSGRRGTSTEDDNEISATDLKHSGRRDTWTGRRARRQQVPRPSSETAGTSHGHSSTGKTKHYY